MTALDLRVGSRVRLTGPGWPRPYRGTVVTVDRIEFSNRAWSNLDGVGYLTKNWFEPFGPGFAIEVIPEPTQPADALTVQLLVTDPNGATIQLAQKNITLEELVKAISGDAGNPDATHSTRPVRRHRMGCRLSAILNPFI